MKDSYNNSKRGRKVVLLFSGRPPMSLSGLTGPATSTNAAYEIMKERREKQDISGYELVETSPQTQSGEREYEVPSPPAVAPSQDGKGGTQKEAVYELIPGN